MFPTNDCRSVFAIFEMSMNGALSDSVATENMSSELYFKIWRATKDYHSQSEETPAYGKQARHLKSFSSSFFSFFLLIPFMFPLFPS